VGPAERSGERIPWQDPHRATNEAKRIIMKYVIVLPDGIADVPIKELGNKTPLEVAKHPNMDWVAANGVTGWSRTIPSGFAPGSDVGCMSVFGYDPRKYYTGRAPIEAAAQGIALGDGDVAFRCNTVAVEDGVMADYSAGHIENEDSAELIKVANERLGKNGLRFYSGVSYRHLAVVQSTRRRRARRRMTFLGSRSRATCRAGLERSWSAESWRNR
jgi:2,3-bisphosphoglycerate-independent phosphoglycerate mutase